MHNEIHNKTTSTSYKLSIDIRPPNRVPSLWSASKLLVSAILPSSEARQMPNACTGVSGKPKSSMNRSRC